MAKTFKVLREAAKIVVNPTVRHARTIPQKFFAALHPVEVHDHPDDPGIPGKYTKGIKTGVAGGEGRITQGTSSTTGPDRGFKGKQSKTAANRAGGVAEEKELDEGKTTDAVSSTMKKHGWERYAHAGARSGDHYDYYSHPKHPKHHIVYNRDMKIYTHEGPLVTGRQQGHNENSWGQIGGGNIVNKLDNHLKSFHSTNPLKDSKKKVAEDEEPRVIELESEDLTEAKKGRKNVYLQMKSFVLDAHKESLILKFADGDVATLSRKNVEKIYAKLTTLKGSRDGILKKLDASPAGLMEILTATGLGDNQLRHSLKK